VPYEPGDSVASALYRDGVRTFSRSFKFHRPRGLYCLTGDCPNCLCRVDGESEVPACTTPAERVARVEREGGWPSVERDAMAVAWYARGLLPVGFYYKIVAAPRVWDAVEPWVRRAAGRGAVPDVELGAGIGLRHVHPDVLVVGAGPAGLAAAVEAADGGAEVLLVDESEPALEVAPGPTAAAVATLLADVAQRPRIELLTNAAAVAVHEGPVVPIRARGQLLVAHPGRVIVATGGIEAHPLFPGNDLPGTWLGRGAARMAGRHGVRLGRRVVLVGETAEAHDHLESIRRPGSDVVAVLLDPDAGVVSAHGRGRLTSVRIERGGTEERIRCDALVVASARVPRDGLLRQAAGIEGVVGAGEAVEPNADLAAAIASGRRAGAAMTDAAGGPVPAPAPPPARTCGGFACLCEDVRTDDLARAWSEGYESTELLKRYTTATMGPCQGAMCHHHLQRFVQARSPSGEAAAATTARPPARPVRIDELAAGQRRPIEERTALHAHHDAQGARWEWAGAWVRPSDYGDLDAEYWAVRERVGIMDVGTLGKLRLSGADATELLERIYPCGVGDLPAGRLRYGVLLSEAGYIFDDGVICAYGDGSYFLTFTTTGVNTAEAWLRRWATAWGLRVNIVNQTRSLGAINVAGPRARDLLGALSSDDLAPGAFPYLQHREIRVAGVSAHAIRLGFVGELGYELHLRAGRAAQVWSALLEAGRDLGIRPHGLETVSVLRLEKGHIIVGQDTDFDTTPRDTGMDWAVRDDKPFFIGKHGLARLAEEAPRRRLRGIRWRDDAPPEGSVVTSGGAFAGNVTSSARSGVLGHGVSLGWLECGDDGSVPATVTAGHHQGEVGTPPFYDPEGVRLRV